MSFLAKDGKVTFPFFETYYEPLPDWGLHFLNFGFLAFVIRTFESAIGAFLLANAFNVAYEFKDAFLRWERIGRFGGDGFSIKDLLFAAAGIAFFIWVIFPYAQLAVWACPVVYLIGIMYKTIFPKKTIS